MKYSEEATAATVDESAEVSTMTVTNEGKSEEPCELCGQNARKYTCPGCSARTCSLRCVQSHKPAFGCDGATKRTRMVTLEQYDALTLLSDYRLLEEAARVAEKNAEILREAKEKRELKKIRVLTAECLKRGIKLDIQPFGLGKSLCNTSQYNPIAETIFWRIEWVFVDAENSTFQNDRNPEGVKLETLLRQFVKSPRPGCDTMISGFADSEQFSAYRPSLQSDKAGVTNWRCYMKVERNGWSKDTRYYQLDVKKTIQENLCGKLVIEFPTIYVSASASACDDSIDDVRFPLLTEATRHESLKKMIWEKTPQRRTFAEHLKLMDKPITQTLHTKPVAAKTSHLKNDQFRTNGNREKTAPCDSAGPSSSELPSVVVHANANAVASDVNNNNSQPLPTMRPLRRLLPLTMNAPPPQSDPTPDRCGRSRGGRGRGRGRGGGGGGLHYSSDPRQQSRNAFALRRDEKRREIDELAMALSREHQCAAEEPPVPMVVNKPVPPAERRYADVLPSVPPVQKDESSAERRYADVYVPPATDVEAKRPRIEKPKNDYFHLLGFNYASSSSNNSENSDLEDGELKDE